MNISMKLKSNFLISKFFSVPSQRKIAMTFHSSSVSRTNWTYTINVLRKKMVQKLTFSVFWNNFYSTRVHYMKSFFFVQCSCLVKRDLFNFRYLKCHIIQPVRLHGNSFQFSVLLFLEQSLNAATTTNNNTTTARVKQLHNDFS